MEAVCPSCGFKGNIGDDRIPDGGRNVTCPRCKTAFFVNKNRSVRPERGTGENLISNPPVGSYGPHLSSPDEKTMKRSPILVCSVLLVTAAFFYILGFISGVVVYEADSDSDVEVSKSLDEAGDKPKSDSSAVKEGETTKAPYSDEDESSLTEVPLSTRKGVEVNKLMESLVPLSEIQVKKYIEDNIYLKVYGVGTVNDVQEMNFYWNTFAKKDYEDNKYGVEVQLDSGKENVVIALAMKDNEVMKINKGDIVRFNGKLVNFRSVDGGLVFLYLDDGKLKKK